MEKNAGNGTLECSHECFNKARLSLQVRPQRAHVLGGRFLWVLCTWLAKVVSSAQISPQIMHLYSAPRAWISAWANRSNASYKY